MIGPAVTPGLCVLVLYLLLASPGLASSRLEEIAAFEGVRDNLPVGYGLVVGLDDTGDSLRNAAFTEESLKAMLDRLGVSARGLNLKTKNVAAVMVTATFTPFARQGSRVADAVLRETLKAQEVA
jgi:flagellar P-ring protein precursor FlgI